MKWLLRVLGSAMLALVVVAGGSLSTAVWLMFSAGSMEGRRLGFFDSIFVEVDQRSDGTTQLGAGISDPLPLIVAAAVVMLLGLAVLFVYDQLLERRRRLLSGVD